MTEIQIVLFSLSLCLFMGRIWYYWKENFMVVIVNHFIFCYDNPIETRDAKKIYRTKWRLK